jgi:hypothetical protein
VTNLRIGILAIALAGCTLETSYTPRTPHVLALGMKNGEAAVYKDGMITLMSSAPENVVRCSNTASAEAREVSDHHASYKLNIQISAVCDVLAALFPPAGGVAVYFAVRANDHLHQANLHLVDTINRHNDENGCVP